MIRLTRSLMNVSKALFELTQLCAAKFCWTGPSTLVFSTSPLLHLLFPFYCFLLSDITPPNSIHSSSFPSFHLHQLSHNLISHPDSEHGTSLGGADLITWLSQVFVSQHVAAATPGGVDGDVSGWVTGGPGDGCYILKSGERGRGTSGENNQVVKGRASFHRFDTDCYVWISLWPRKGQHSKRALMWHERWKIRRYYSRRLTATRWLLGLLLFCAIRFAPLICIWTDTDLNSLLSCLTGWQTQTQANSLKGCLSKFPCKVPVSSRQWIND